MAAYIGNECTPDEAEQYFEYLDELRDEGSINMFGARPYLARQFGLDGDLALAVLSAWTVTFKRGVPASERAAQAFGK